MSDLLAARSQMAMSLGFHIIFSAIAIAMPLLMIVAEWLYHRTKDSMYLELAKRWSKGTTILFAVGAVSGTVLSFELGLLWPKFMEFAGPIIGMPFSLEGFAFFLEAIFLGIYLYGWDKVPPLAHWLSGAMVLICGTVSGIFVVCANGWMNTPTGFTLSKEGHVLSINPFLAMFNPAAFPEALHMTLAAFMAVSFAVAGIHAIALLRGPFSRFHQHAFRIAFIVAAIAAPITIVSGDISAKYVAKHQPIKLAAMEGLWNTAEGAPLTIGGLPNASTQTTLLGVEVPYLLSFLAYGDPHAIVRGLTTYPQSEWPPVAVVHIAFQLMIVCGLFMCFTSWLILFLYWRRKDIISMRWPLKLMACTIPMGFIAIEAGWTVTEVGRQPWIIYNLMRTASAVTPMPHLVIPFTLFSLLYVFLGVVVLILLKQQVFQTVYPKIEKEHHV